MSLKNRTVLITRRREQSAALVSEIERRGGRALVLPAIRILDPESWDACDAALGRLASYDGAAFASTNAVEKFFSRAHHLGSDLSALRAMRLWAAGKRTAAAIAAEGFPAVSMPAESGAEALAGAMIAEGVRGKKYLLPRSAIGREELPGLLEKAGALIDSVVVYRTVPPEAEEMKTVVRQLLEGQVDVLAFASPSAVRNFFAVVPHGSHDALRGKTKLAVIGPATAQAVRDQHTEPDIVAQEATDGGLAEAIDHYYDAHP